MKCIHCERDIDDTTTYCPWCGYFIEKEDRLPLERVQLVFMRADLAGFTRMSEAMIPEDVMAFLNEVFGVFSKVIESYKGIIYQVIGDEVVSIFGFPVEEGFAPHMAILAAEDLLKKLNELNKKEYLKNPVGLKIGMAMEPALLLAIHRDLKNTVIVTKGFTKCQILQKNASDNTLLVCENLYQATKAFFSYQEIGSFSTDALTVKAYEYTIKAV